MEAQPFTAVTWARVALGVIVGPLVLMNTTSGVYYPAEHQFFMASINTVSGKLLGVIINAGLCCVGHWAGLTAYMYVYGCECVLEKSGII